MLVKQTVLTEDGFSFWTGLSKNTEQLGYKWSIDFRKKGFMVYHLP